MSELNQGCRMDACSIILCLYLYRCWKILSDFEFGMLKVSVNAAILAQNKPQNAEQQLFGNCPPVKSVKQLQTINFFLF